MKKNNHYKKEIEFKIGEDNVDALMKLADSPEGEELGIFKFQDSNAKGVTFGRKLGCFEREGEGLPTPNDDCPRREFHFEFDVRFTLNESDDLELLIAAKGTGRHFKYMLKGLGAAKANAAVMELERRIAFRLQRDIYHLAWACYRSQEAENLKTKGKLQQHCGQS